MAKAGPKQKTGLPISSQIIQLSVRGICQTDPRDRELSECVEKTRMNQKQTIEEQKPCLSNFIYLLTILTDVFE